MSYSIMAEVKCEGDAFDDIKQRVGDGFLFRQLPFLIVIRGNHKTLQDALNVEEAIKFYPEKTLMVNSERG